MPDLPPDLPSALQEQRAAEVRNFDLAKIKSPVTCGQSSGGQIIVCAQDSKRHRLLPLPQTFADTEPPKAELVLPNGGSIAVSAQAQSVGGFNSNRVMAGVKLPF